MASPHRIRWRDTPEGLVADVGHAELKPDTRRHTGTVGTFMGYPLTLMEIGLIAKAGAWNQERFLFAELPFTMWFHEHLTEWLQPGQDPNVFFNAMNEFGRLMAQKHGLRDEFDEGTATA